MGSPNKSVEAAAIKNAGRVEREIIRDNHNNRLILEQLQNPVPYQYYDANGNSYPYPDTQVGDTQVVASPYCAPGISAGARGGAIFGGPTYRGGGSSLSHIIGGALNQGGSGGYGYGGYGRGSNIFGNGGYGGYGGGNGFYNNGFGGGLLNNGFSDGFSTPYCAPPYSAGAWNSGYNGGFGNQLNGGQCDQFNALYRLQQLQQQRNGDHSNQFNGGQGDQYTQFNNALQQLQMQNLQLHREVEALKFALAECRKGHNLPVNPSQIGRGENRSDCGCGGGCGNGCGCGGRGNNQINNIRGLINGIEHGGGCSNCGANGGCGCNRGRDRGAFDNYADNNNGCGNGGCGGCSSCNRGGYGGYGGYGRGYGGGGILGGGLLGGGGMLGGFGSGLLLGSLFRGGLFGGGFGGFGRRRW